MGGESHLFRYFSLHPDAGRYLLFSRFALVCPLSYRRYSIFTMFEKTHLIKLAQMKMPFGKYAGRALIDLPEPYLLWFQKQGFPEGELGAERSPHKYASTSPFFLISLMNNNAPLSMSRFLNL